MSMFSIVLKKRQFENMSSFSSLPEFDREKKKLAKKFRTIDDDLVTFEKLIRQFPTGIGKNFTILHDTGDVKMVKARLACKALRNNSLRVIYAYHENTITFVYIELYFKGSKENENVLRVQEYLKKLFS